MTSTEIALPSQQNADRPTIGAMIQQLRPELSRALPRGMDADRMARLALTVLRQTPDLANCSPESFAGALLTAAALGLEPGVNGEAYLVPYKRECQLIIGYQGYTKLFYQSPLARHIDAQPVYANDAFDYAYGTAPFLTHKPASGDRGALVLYYAVATLTTGANGFVVLTPDEVKSLRQGKVGPSGRISDPMRWMERKTALRQLVKLLPRSTKLNAAMVADEELGSSLRARKAPESIAPPNVNTETGEIIDGEWADDDTPVAPPSTDDPETDPWTLGERS